MSTQLLIRFHVHRRVGSRRVLLTESGRGVESLAGAEYFVIDANKHNQRRGRPNSCRSGLTPYSVESRTEQRKRGEQIEQAVPACREPWADPAHHVGNRPRCQWDWDDARQPDRRRRDLPPQKIIQSKASKSGEDQRQSRQKV